jgi:V/A-type H+-transporting ATPase subunit F
MEKKEIAVVGSRNFTLGFRLAGIRKIFWIDGKSDGEIKDMVRDVISREDVGVVIVEKGVLEKFSRKEREEIEALTNPVVVEFSEEFKSERLRRKIAEVLGVDLL